MRKRDLKRQFGVNIERGEVGLVDLPELQNRFHLKCEMEFEILTVDGGLPGFSRWERISGQGYMNGAGKKELPIGKGSEGFGYVFNCNNQDSTFHFSNQDMT